MKYETDWLQSDGTIIGRAQKNPHKEGIMWSVTMPDGQEFGAVLAESNAASVVQFCNLVRDEWNERKEEQEAKAASKAYSAEPSGDSPVASAVPTPQAGTSFTDGLVEQLTRAKADLVQVLAERDRLVLEVGALAAACDVLSLSHDVKTSIESVEDQLDE